MSDTSTSETAREPPPPAGIQFGGGEDAHLDAKLHVGLGALVVVQARPVEVEDAHSAHGLRGGRPLRADLEVPFPTLKQASAGAISPSSLSPSAPLPSSLSPRKAQMQETFLASNRKTLQSGTCAPHAQHRRSAIPYTVRGSLRVYARGHPAVVDARLTLRNGRMRHIGPLHL